MTKSKHPLASHSLEVPARAYRVRIEGVWPEIDAGRFPAKRICGDTLVVRADLVADGHEIVDGLVRYRHEEDEHWSEVPLEPLGNDRYETSFQLTKIGIWQYTIVAWLDAYATWRYGIEKKWKADQDLTVDLLIGAQLVADAQSRAGKDSARLGEFAAVLRNAQLSPDERVEAALSPELGRILRSHPDRHTATTYDRVLEIVVDVERARFSAWYEFFPRSCGEGQRHGTFRDSEGMLPYIAEMGFDVVYLPPIHPIGRVNRKGKNNSLNAGPEDPGSPWAIGAEEGGHFHLHPELGNWNDFEHFVRAVEVHGMQLALDIAFQATPDHPWVSQHPEWFRQRPDGTIQYAENPPKKYQDIYPLDFESSDWPGLWRELATVFLFWISKGVRIFRVDNPHTKSLPFWEWCIREVKKRHPETLFLAEAFTRPKVMYQLAKLGFSQSYTYFTWRVEAAELGAYMSELSVPPVSDFFRPNFWPNTPDILTEQLQTGARSTFIVRAVLASTMSSNWGVYGPAYELLEHLPRRGSEEYLDNEKYELRAWDLERPDSLRPLLRDLNAIRRENLALQSNTGFAQHACDNDMLFCYSKSTPDYRNVILVVVNLHPEYKHSGWTTLDMAALGLSHNETFVVHDLLSDQRYPWHGERNFIELDPHRTPVHLFRIERDGHR